MYWTCLYGVHAKYVGFSCNISGCCLRGSHFEAQPQRLYSKLLFVVLLSNISTGTGESHCYFFITFRFKNFLQLAADVASLNIVQVLHTQVTVMQYLVYCELLIYILERRLSDTECLHGWRDVRVYVEVVWWLPSASNYVLGEWIKYVSLLIYLTRVSYSKFCWRLLLSCRYWGEDYLHAWNYLWKYVACKRDCRFRGIASISSSPPLQV